MEQHDERAIKERLDWIEEHSGEMDKRLGNMEGYLSHMDQTLENHMHSYGEKLQTMKEAVWERIDAVNWKLSLLAILITTTVIALLAIVVTLIVVAIT